MWLCDLSIRIISNVLSKTKQFFSQQLIFYTYKRKKTFTLLTLNQIWKAKILSKKYGYITYF